MPHHTHSFTIATTGPGLTDFTREVTQWVTQTGVATGLLTMFCRHTSASLLITENAAPAVQRDLARWLDRMAPQSREYEHDCEGADDMPAHLKQVLTGTTLSIPILDGAMALGTWQGVFLAEHRAAPHHRQIAAHIHGE